MSRLALVLGLLAAVGNVSVFAADPADADIPLAEIDKRYAADHAKESARQKAALENRIAKAKGFLAEFRNQPPFFLEGSRREIDNCEKRIEDIKTKPETVSPILNPAKLQLGQAGRLMAEAEHKPAVATVKKIVDQDTALVRLPGGDTIVLIDSDIVLNDRVELLKVDRCYMVVGRRAVDGKSYLYLQPYVLPADRPVP